MVRSGIGSRVPAERMVPRFLMARRTAPPVTMAAALAFGIAACSRTEEVSPATSSAIYISTAPTTLSTSTVKDAGSIVESRTCDFDAKGLKDQKVALIANKAFLKLAEGESAHEIANYIRLQSVDCFNITDQSARQVDILKSMWESVCAKEDKSRGVKLEDVVDLGSRLGKTVKKTCSEWNVL